MREMAAVVAEISLRLVPEAGSVQEARRALERFRGLVPGERLADARLVVSELVTNELRYAGLSAGEDVITVCLAAHRRRIEGQVCSAGEGFVPPARPRGDLSGGWGLAIVDAVCDRWEVRREAEESCVWFELRWAEGASQPSG
jgi:anti-sigma regulatory factor (Ser/Thr protein kinase)